MLKNLDMPWQKPQHLQTAKANFKCCTLETKNKIENEILFNHNLNCGCLVYMFSLHYSGSKFLINLRWQFCVCKFFRVRKIFRTQVLVGFAIFPFCV